MKISRKRTTTASIDIKDRGIVLRNYQSGEKDRLVILLTEKNGRMAAWARGARSSRSGLSALTESFIEAQFSLKAGSKYVHIQQGKLINGFMNIRKDTRLFCAASILIEIADKGVPEGGEALDYVNLLSHCLDIMNNGENPDGVIYLYAKYFLHISGLAAEEPDEYSNFAENNLFVPDVKELSSAMRLLINRLEIKDNAWQMYKTMYC